MRGGIVSVTKIYTAGALKVVNSNHKMSCNTLNCRALNSTHGKLEDR